MDLLGPCDHVYVTCAAMQRYARGVALATTGDVDGALKEADALATARQAPQLQERSRHVVSAARTVEVAEAVLLGEILYRQYCQGKADHDTAEPVKEQAFAQLRRAVQLDDGLPYDEPWGWMMPARHPLGALLLESGEVDAALQVYREDLAPGKHPGTIWSLVGLKQCLEVLRDSRALSREETHELSEVCRQIDESRRDMGNGADQVVASCACATSRWSAGVSPE